MGFKITKKIYGGKFTSLLPPLLAGVALLFFMQILESIFLFSQLHNEMASMVSLQVIQLVSGILFIKSTYQFYQMGFATSGIYKGK